LIYLKSSSINQIGHTNYRKEKTIWQEE